MADGISIAAYDADEIAGTIDSEDYSFLFELLRLKTGGYRSEKKRLKQYNHVVLDEAQDLAAIELKLLSGVLRKNGSFTVAGDSSQHINVAARFEGWDAVLANLGCSNASPVELKTIYRSPKPVADFAFEVLGTLAPPERPNVLKEGAPVVFSGYPHEGFVAMALVETLEDLTRTEPRASIAIICRDGKQAKTVYAGLANFLSSVKLVLDGEFRFEQTVEVTEVSQVKGLEFDYVVVPDADALHYPITSESRRCLHVAATRAIHQLWIMWEGEKSPIFKIP